MSAPQPTFVIACGVFRVDLEHLLAGLDPPCGTRFLPGGLHENPTALREQIQRAIDEASREGRWTRIAIAYGLCGRGTSGLTACDIPLTIARVPDCIALFLGSRDRYHREFKRYPGTYYLSTGWHHEKSQPLRQRRAQISIGAATHTYADLVNRYGEAAARETFAFFNSWKANYKRAAFIDTGQGDTETVAEYAREMAAEQGWLYERIPGDLNLLRRLITARVSDADILVVPPGQITHYDPLSGGLAAHPRAQSVDTAVPPEANMADRGASLPTPHIRLGLGIDAGGTYTDAVIYDFADKSVVAKNKALTTRWNFMHGIAASLEDLPADRLKQVELVSVSTTLATNAVVEGEGQTVGLLVMPPYGLSIDGEISHRPMAVIDGQIDIGGEVRSPIDPQQVRRVVGRMIHEHGVFAFAVSGYAGSVNPEHEMAVKALIEAQTGCFVTCGHELSRLLNFKTRAQTAVLNARIVPRLVDLLGDLKRALSARGIAAPIMVVKGDGSLMSCEMAMQRPVETILSGPAASVAGARFLTGIADALVVDMGGTTTDTAVLEHGQVAVSEQGATVGDIHTHVRALEIRTAGLGGDSLIGFEKGIFTIGPRRVAPLCWLGSQRPGPQAALAYLKARSDAYRGSAHALQILTATNRAFSTDLPLGEAEEAVLVRLRERPHALDELAQRCGTLHAALLPLQRLEERFLIQRCGLTPTDLLHIRGDFERWDTDSARQMLAVMAAVSGIAAPALTDRLLEQVIRDLARELIKRQLAGRLAPGAFDPETLTGCATCRALLDQMLTQTDSGAFAIRFQLRRPVVGIGAPTGHFLPEAAKRLGSEAVMPDHWEVANAVGAITSPVIVTLEARIKPDPRGGFAVQGLAGDHLFPSVAEAQTYAQKALQDKARRLARQAGTDADAIRLISDDQVARTATGFDLFISRKVAAQIIGVPLPELMEESGQGSTMGSSLDEVPQRSPEEALQRRI
jgi:N-methylhydantoinase A/oxoprolinase/acetone carboxylase beta subunit